MALDTKATSGFPLNPAGMNDNIPLDVQADWYQTRGLHSLNDQSLQRCNGKFLIKKFDSPILAIHGSLHERLFIETSTTLYIVDRTISKIKVFGAGVTEVNRTYTARGFFLGKFFYNPEGMIDSVSSSVIKWTTGFSPSWVITDSFTTVIYRSQIGQNVKYPSLATWVIGTPPLPIVTSL